MRLAAAAALLALFAPAYAQMYKCVDARGVAFYSDKPQPGCVGGPVNIQASPPISGSLAPQRGSDSAGQDAQFKRRQIERDEAEQHEKQAAALRCAKLRNEYGVLSTGGRIYHRNSLGERVYLEDSARDARLAALKEELRRCP